MSNPGMQLTLHGRNLLAKALLGKELKFSKVAYGSGDFDYETEKVSELTALRHWRMDLPIINKIVTGDGTAEIHARLTNFDLEEGFAAKEIGVYAFDPDTGVEYLYAYRNAGDEYTFIPAKTGPVQKNTVMAYRVEIQDATNVTCIIDFDFAYTSQAEFDEHVANNHPHPNIPNHYANTSTPDYFWTTNDDNHLHKISVDDAKEVLLTEMNQYLSDQKEAQADIEDYRTFQKYGLQVKIIGDNRLDDTKVQVTSCTKGGNVLGVTDISKLKIGLHYRLSDGIKSEIVQIAAIGFGSGADYVKTTALLANAYDLSAVYLYRTNFSFGAIKTISIPGEEFSGIEAGTVRELGVRE